MFANRAAVQPTDCTTGDQEGHRVAPAPPDGARTPVALPPSSVPCAIRNGGGGGAGVLGRSVVGVWSPEHLGGTPSAGDQAGRAHPARSGATTPGQGCSQGRSVLRGRWTARRCRPARRPDARPSRRPRRRRCAAASPWSPCSAGRRGSLRAGWRSPRGGPAGSRRHGSGPGRRPAARTGLLAANVEPYLRADGTKVWSLMQLESEVEGLEHAPRLVQCWSRPVGRSCWGVGRPRWWRR
jgi:hypothetical protein